MCFIALAVVENKNTGTGLVPTGSRRAARPGTLMSLGAGMAGGAVLDIARRKEWMAPPLAQLGMVAIPLLCMMASEAVHATMFIAAFVADIRSRTYLRGMCRKILYGLD